MFDFIAACHREEPEGYYRVQYGTEIRIYQIEGVFTDGVLFKDGDQIRLFPIGSFTFEPMTGKDGGKRNPQLTKKALKGFVLA